jgi:apurinic endonuclease APN1
MTSKGPHYYGAHVSASGGLENALVNAKTLNVNAIQIHPSPPQRWNAKPFVSGYEEKFLAALPGSGVERIFFHGIYLINLANPDPQKQQLSRLSLMHDLDLMGRISGPNNPGAGVIFHVGSMLDDPNEIEGWKRAAEALNWVFANCPQKQGRVILEVAAGSGNVIGDKLEDLRAIYDQVDEQERLGFGLDSQHLWASGYNLRDEFEGIVTLFSKVFSFEKIWCVHLNDSKTALGSRKDRHENLGDGLIGREALHRFLMHPAFKEIPFILETPALKSMESAVIEVEKLRGIISGG